MPHSITLQINPESLNFLKSYKNKTLSLKQESFLEIVTKIYRDLSELKKQTLFEFTKDNEAELARGYLYAISQSLLENYPPEISLENFQTTLENEFYINNKETLSFIVLCLVEPLCLPNSLPAIACSLLIPDYICDTQPPLLAAKLIEKDIFFQLNLDIKTCTDEAPRERGKIIIQFTIDHRKQLKLLPIHIDFNFPDEKESKEFQQKLTNDFQSWLLHQDELATIQAKLFKMPIVLNELCILPLLFGLCIGLIAMISFIALGLSMTSVLMLPPLGLALGLMLVTLANSCAYLDKRKEQKKLQRPIYLFNKKQLPVSQTQRMLTTSFFIPHEPNPMIVENRWAYHP